jgi:hypothetical protein
MKISDLMPPRVGYAGPRSLAAFLALATLGAIFYFVGLITSGSTAKGVGVLFFFGGLICTAAILLRWLIYREIG